MAYKCVIFDCDGVLVDSETISNSVLIALAASQGISISLEYVIQNFAGQSLKSCFNHLENTFGVTLPPNFETEYRNTTFERFKTELEPVKGVKQVLENLTLPACVASSGPRDKIELNLTTTGMLHHFENRIYSAYDIGSWKPDPGIFLHAAKDMGYAPEECVVIEDSRAGVEAGLAGGFSVLAYADPKYDHNLEGLGVTQFNSMLDLPSILC